MFGKNGASACPRGLVLYHFCCFLLVTSIYLLDSCSTCCNRCVHLFSPVWLYSHCQGHQKPICFSLLQHTSPVRRMKFTGAAWGERREKNRFNVEHLRQSIQTVKKLRCDSFPPCSAHTRRHPGPRPPGGGVSSPQTEHTSWSGPASALPEELRSKPAWGRGGARPAEPGPNKRSAHPPLHAD